jgi:DNA processing protein
VKQNALTEILQLINTDGIGPISFYKYVNECGSVSGALNKLKNKKEVASQSFAEDEIARAINKGIKIIAFCDKEYPQSLRNIPDAPPVLYAIGNIELLQYPLAIAIVGARNASINGRKIASRIAYDLTENDVLIISGMARGIDSSAHKGAMYAKGQKGPTIAVLGTGVNKIYPSENTNLYTEISQQGLLISEFSLDTEAQISNFPRRNRIISALSSGTLVVEASLHSGSLITAKTALEQGKEIFAIPGSPIENRSQGPNKLIKDGAILTESAEDILNILSINQNQQIKNCQMELLPLDKAKNSVNISQHKESVEAPKCNNTKLIDLITYQGVEIDELLRASNLTQAIFFEQLLSLEFEGKIERQVGNKVSRIR